MAERFDTNEKIKGKIKDMLFDACIDKNVGDIAKLSRAYNDVCQAIKAQTMPTILFDGNGLTYSSAVPTTD